MRPPPASLVACVDIVVAGVPPIYVPAKLKSPPKPPAARALGACFFSSSFLAKLFGLLPCKGGLPAAFLAAGLRLVWPRPAPGAYALSPGSLNKSLLPTAADFDSSIPTKFVPLMPNYYATLASACRCSSACKLASIDVLRFFLAKVLVTLLMILGAFRQAS